MVQKIFKIILILGFMTMGTVLGIYFLPSNIAGLTINSPFLKGGIVTAIALVCGLIGALLAPWIVGKVLNATWWMEQKLQKIPTQDILGGAVGLIIGLIIANLLSSSLSGIRAVPGLGWLGILLPIISSLLFGYLGLSLGAKKKEDLFSFIPRFGRDKVAKSEHIGTMLKILDTSVIIDGRIADICKSGFIEGTLIIPNFVLNELQHIADSSDLLKRNRGRRGLDILNKIRKELDVKVQIIDKDYEDILEVDSKLVKMAQDLDAIVITNDFNLNKVAEFKGVQVLNINELANAVKPIVLPGEEMDVQIIKEGKESGQGIAYLDDGTMIVVEGGRKHLNQNIVVVVTSALQTAAGRMIFAKPKLNDYKVNEKELDNKATSTQFNEVNAIV